MVCFGKGGVSRPLTLKNFGPLGRVMVKMISAMYVRLGEASPSGGTPLPPTYSSDRVGGKAIKFPLMRGRSWGWEAKGPCESQKTSSKERLVLYVHHPDARLGQRHQ